jgi:hypothetical protein
MEVTPNPEMQLDKGNQLGKSLLNDVDTTNMVYFGGTILTKDLMTLKKLLFRITRGHAVITQFNLKVHDEDKIRGDQFEKERSGYIVLVQDTPELKARVERICQSFILSDEWKVF